METSVERERWLAAVKLLVPSETPPTIAHPSATAGEGAVARLPLPETLRLDAGRLHAAQGDCQRLLVTATCLLLVRQAAAAAGQVCTAWGTGSASDVAPARPV